MAPSSRLRSASATKRKGSIGGSAKAASTSAKQGKSSAEKRAATIAAKKAKDSEVEPEDDAGEESSEDDKENSEKDSGGDDGTDGSSSTGSDISEDTKEELLKLITARKAAKKRKVSPTSTAVVLAIVPELIASDAMPVAAFTASVSAATVPPLTVTLGDFMVVPDATKSVAPLDTVTALEATAFALATESVPADTVVGPV